MLKVIHSNRLERLFDRLAEVLERPVGGPMKPETLVVQNPGMGRWVNLRLAERLGIAANIRYPLPAGFVWDLLREHLPELPEQSTFDRPVLTWRIMDLLPECLHAQGFEAIEGYLAREPDDLKWYQLSRRLADLFDQYLVYRPDWIQGWEEGRDGHWQARLWRLLTEQGDHNHRAGLVQRYLRDLKAGKIPGEALPERVCVFGLAALPPLYLGVLETIGALTEVYLFVLNPCLSYWGHIVDEKTLARLQGQWRHKGWPDVSELYPVGNSLLASLGKLGRDSLELVHEAPCEDEEAFDLQLPDSLLGAIQQDMLLLQEAGQYAGPGVRALAPDDRSLEVHACHGPMREVEVLYDQLLSLLDRHPHHPGLRPCDIVVMTPDIDAYAPYIDAVFGAASGERLIPWSIADRTPPAEHALMQVFLQLLRLPGSRFEASEIASLLEVPAIRRRAGLDEAGLEKVLRWIRESGIRWGLDHEFREAMGIPDSGQNTWRFGLDRLLLGYAMPVGSPSCRGILPYTDIEGSDGEDLGRLHAYIARLEDLRRQLARKHTPEDWRRCTGELLALFDPGPNEDDAHAISLIRDAMEAFAEQTGNAGFSRPMGIEVLRDHLEASLRERTPPHRFLTGGLTFCRMMPLRSIPFRVVCLIGMNDRSYPRQERAPGFDLVARDPHPRRGDRSRRDDDRYLFLEGLLSAREKLYISYVGRSLRDNSETFPSVLVSELLDYVEKGFRGPAENLRDWLVVQHPMQPFSRAYLDPGSPFVFSYSEHWLGAGRAPGRREDRVEPPFIRGPLGEPGEEFHQLDLTALVRFLKNPAGYFLRERLGLHLGEEEQEPEDEEAFTLDPLTAYQIKQSCLEALLAGQDRDALFAELRLSGLLPHGEFGRLAIEQHCAGIEAFAEQVRGTRQDPLEPLDIDLEMKGVRLTGRLTHIARDGLLRYRFTKRKAGDLIELWVCHLVLNTAGPEGYPLQSLHLGSDGGYRFGPVADAEGRLADLLRCYREGLRRPLPLFPRASYAWAEKHAEGAPEDEMLSAALNQWQSNAFRPPGEDQDPCFALITRGREPLDQAFRDTAVRIFGPPIAHLHR